tara:strand:- start:14986 stop:15246 length:261 start_codon:yes stop_codon:yes gene_type:complete
MLEKKVDKLFLGKYVSIRDYIWHDAIARGGLIIAHKDKKMFIDAEDLKKLKPSGKFHQSKFKGKYQLVDIRWKSEKDTRQQGLFDE